MKKTILLLILPSLMMAQSFKIQDDKQLHFVAGALAGTAAYVATYSITKSEKKSFIYATAFSILTGTVKELVDRNNGKKFDVRDIAATGLGGMTVSIAITIPLFKKS